MALHPELRPDDSALGLVLASTALSRVERLGTRHSGVIVVDNADGSQSQIGGGDSDSSEPLIPWIGDETIPGRPTGLSASCFAQIVTVYWDGTLEGGVPADFAYIELYAQPDKEPFINLGRMTSAGEVATGRLPVGEIVDIWAVAYDDAHGINGAPNPHKSGESEHLAIIVEPLVDQTQMHEAEKKADELAGKITEVTATVNGQQTKLTELDSKIEGVASDGEATAKQLAETKQTLEGFRQAVSQTYETKSDALQRETTLSQSVTSLGSTVKETYATKTTVQELSSTVTQTKEGLEISIKQAQTSADNAQSTADTALTQGDELLYNGGFELGVDGWVLNSDDIKTDSPYSGANYLRTTAIQIVSSHPIPVTQGRTYRFGCMFRRAKAQPDGSYGGLRLQCSDDGKTWEVLKNTEFGTKAYMNWTYMSVDATIRAKKYIRARIAFGGITSKQDFDDLSIRDVTDLLDAKSDAANAAGRAQDAQSRVGAIETCIRNTADGVRVGYAENGVYTGYSALVNANGSFDVLDADGKVAARFNKDSIDLLEDADGARGKFERYMDGLNISCPQTYLNGAPADSGYCWCTIRDYEVAGARQKTDEHGGYVSVIQYQESPGGQNNWALTTDGKYLVTPYDGWYLLNGTADVWKESADHNIWAFYRVRYGDGTYGNLCGATRTLCAVGSTDDPQQRWYRQNLPTVTCYLHAGDGLFMGVSARAGGGSGDSFMSTLSGIMLGPRCQLNITKLPFGNIYHGRKEKSA